MNQSSVVAGHYRTALLYAAKECRLEVAKVLLDNGAEVDKSDEYEVTPLIIVICQFGYLPLGLVFVELLPSRGAKVDAPDKRGRSPLFAATLLAPKHNTFAMKLLLDYNANVNLADHDGSTPIHVAWNSESVLLLLSHRANVNVRNHFDVTPLMVAADRGLLDVAK